MDNLKNNIKRLVKSINGELTEESLKVAIEEFESTLTFVNSLEEAQEYFKECGIEGHVFERKEQKLTYENFDIVIFAYYVDPGSVDYVYQVNVKELNY